MTETSTIKRRFIACLHEHERLGSSFVAEGMITWLDFAGVPYLALDLDPCHQSLYRRHPKTVRLIDTQGGLSPGRPDHTVYENCVGVLRMLEEEAPYSPVILTDFPYHRRPLVQRFFDDLPTLKLFDHLSIRMTLLVFMRQETRTLDAIEAMIKRFQSSVDYLLIDNPGCYLAASDRFKETKLYAWFQERGCATFQVPRCSSHAINHEWNGTLEHVGELDLEREHFSLEQAYNHPDLSFTTRAELSALRQGFIEECEKHARLLVPDEGLIKRRYLDSFE